MGDKTWHFIDCPKCGGKETVECFEHDSGWLKVDSCSECDYVKNYEYEEKDGVIHITEVSDLVATDNQSQDEPLKSATPDIDTQIESLLRPAYSYESDDCTLCGHNQSYHYWNGGGRIENSSYDSCKAEGCDCDGVFDEKGYLIIQTTSQLDDEPYQKAHKAIKTLLDTAVQEARIDENQRWANGYAQVLLDYPDIDEPELFMKAKGDFEDRIKQLKATSKEKE